MVILIKKGIFDGHLEITLAILRMEKLRWLTRKYLPGYRPVIVKRAVIGSKGRLKLSTIFLSCKVFHDLSIIKLGNILYL